MRFEWEDSETGRYECQLFDDNNELAEISFIDYTSKFHQEYDRKNHYERAYSFEVHYCDGWSMHQGFDYDDNYNHHWDENERTIGGYQGNCTHTVEDIKKWCEEFLADMFIIDYEKELKELEERKVRSDWFLTHGYTGEYENKRNR